MTTLYNRQALARVLASMCSSAIHNYVTPGLSSYKIGGDGLGMVRTFHAERETIDSITPHSHRFDFACIVLHGTVWNTVYDKWHDDASSDTYALGMLTGDGLGSYKLHPGEEPVCFRKTEQRFMIDEVYSLEADEIHSIRFAKGTDVLFIEGPPRFANVQILEPWVRGKRVPTFETRPWMFEKEPAA